MESRRRGFRWNAPDERVISVAAYEKVFIVSSVAAMPSGSLATTRKVLTWLPFSQRIKQTVMLHFYSANLMRDALLNDRVELQIFGDVGAKIRVMNFDTTGVQVPNFLCPFPFSLQFFNFSSLGVDESCNGCL
ncbi:hypothetical protein Ahy_A05g024092 [Arachis hypogaea]|uniref:Uncharacterized protein n=1 Tax=Arachis hypogaea TaxID=3818 RepID=A0A445D598_ARAHY|nr:hypothetical protein Ahy_A05g024092 [Arachis hypogaea]